MSAYTERIREDRVTTKEDITMKGDQKICPARRGAPRRQDCPGERAAGEEKRL